MCILSNEGIYMWFEASADMPGAVAPGLWHFSLYLAIIQRKGFK